MSTISLNKTSKLIKLFLVAMLFIILMGQVAGGALSDIKNQIFIWVCIHFLPLAYFIYNQDRMGKDRLIFTFFVNAYLLLLIAVVMSRMLPSRFGLEWWYGIFDLSYSILIPLQLILWSFIFKANGWLDFILKNNQTNEELNYANQEVTSAIEETPILIEEIFDISKEEIEELEVMTKDNKIEEVLEKIIDCALNENSEVKKDAIHTLRNYKQVQEDYARSIVSYKDYNIERSKLSLSTLHIIDDLKLKLNQTVQE